MHSRCLLATLLKRLCLLVRVDHRRRNLKVSRALPATLLFQAPSQAGASSFHATSARPVPPFDPLPCPRLSFYRSLPGPLYLLQRTGPPQLAVTPSHDPHLTREITSGRFVLQPCLQPLPPHPQQPANPPPPTTEHFPQDTLPFHSFRSSSSCLHLRVPLPLVCGGSFAFMRVRCSSSTRPLSCTHVVSEDYCLW